MSWFKPLKVAAACMLLTACGFQPIAAVDRPDLAPQKLFRSIAVSTNIDRLTYHVRNQMRLYIDEANSEYPALTVQVVLVREGLAIEQDDSITRIKLTTTTRFTTSNSEGTVELQGVFETVTGLNATDSQFTTSISEREAYRRLATDIVRQLVNRQRAFALD